MAVDLGTYGETRGDTRAVPPASPVPARPRPRRRPGRGELLLVALATLLAADVGLVAGHARASDRGPVAAARSLLAALATADGAAAVRLVVPPAGQSRLTAADARAQHGQLAEVRALSRRGDTATVAVAFDHPGFGQPGRSLTLTLRRRGGGLLSAPRWRVVGGLPVLRLSAPGYETGAVVDGRPLPLDHGGADVTVFPGTVAVGLPAAPPAAALATTAAATTTRPRVALTPRADTATEDAVSRAVAFRVIRGGEQPQGPNAVHPSHIDIGALTLGPDGRTLTFAAVLDMLIRTQPAYNSPTLALTGTATYSGGQVTLTSLRTTPLGSPLSTAPPSTAPAP